MLSQMATTTLQRRQGLSRGTWLGGGIALIVLVIIAALVLNGRANSSAAPTVATTTVTRGSVVATVAGSGTVAPAQALDLSFQTSGTVTQVLVKDGDLVKANQPLAQLDTRDLELQVASAQTALRQAELDLQSQRDSSSASKTKAEKDLHKATDSLTQAQSKYATALKNWQYVQETNADPTNPTTTSADGKKVKNKLSDTQRQQYYDTYVQAEAALHSAETAVQQAQVTYDNARQAE